MSVRKIETRFDILRLLLAVFLAMGVAVVIILFLSDDPQLSLKYLLLGPLTTKRRFGNVIESVIPLLFTGVGVCIMYSANQTNMAAEGSFFLGGVFATAIAIRTMPPVIHPILCILFGGVAGSFVTMLPALLYTRFGARPVVSSLMMNHIASSLGIFMINYLFFDASAGFTCSLPFQKTAKLPVFVSKTSIHIGIFIGVFVVIMGWFYLYRSKNGYEIRTVGKNVSFAKYIGISVPSVIIYCQVIGGFLAGMGGAVEVLGMYNRFQYQGLTNHGFDGILVAIIAKYNPAMVPFSALFLSYVRVGADIMSRMTDVPVEIVYVVQSVIILFVTAERFLGGLKHKSIVREIERSMAQEEKANG